MTGRASTILIARPTGYGITVTSSADNPYSAPMLSRDSVGACALPEYRHVVRVATEHSDVVTHPAQRHHQIPQ